MVRDYYSAEARRRLLYGLMGSRPGYRVAEIRFANSEMAVGALEDGSEYFPVELELDPSAPVGWRLMGDGPVGMDLVVVHSAIDQLCRGCLPSQRLAGSRALVSAAYKMVRPGGCLAGCCSNHLAIQRIKSVIKHDGVFSSDLWRPTLLLAGSLRKIVCQCSFHEISFYSVHPSIEAPRSIVPMSAKAQVDFEGRHRESADQGRVCSLLDAIGELGWVSTGLSRRFAPALLFVGVKA